MAAFLVHLLTLAAIYVLIVLSYALPVGYTGLLNLGHVGLLAIGAYTAAILTTHGVSFWLSLLAGAILTAAAAWLLALPARRIKDDYYALMSLGFLFVVNAVALNWIGLTRGPFGIAGIPRPEGFVSPERFLLLAGVITVAIALVLYRVIRSPFGHALEAVRDDDLVAKSLGKPVDKLRIMALTISGLIAGIAGGLLAHFIQFINPQLFWLDLLVFVLTALVVGGLASFRGAILGAVLLFAITEPIRFLALPPSLLGPLRLMIFAVLLLLVVLVRPKGLVGRAQLGE